MSQQLPSLHDWSQATPTLTPPAAAPAANPAAVPVTLPATAPSNAEVDVLSNHQTRLLLHPKSPESPAQPSSQVLSSSQPQSPLSSGEELSEEAGVQLEGHAGTYTAGTSLILLFVSLLWYGKACQHCP